MEYSIAIITSVIALIAAIVSSVISYFSTKRTAKVEAQKGYLVFLRHKMTRLENLLESTSEYLGKSSYNRAKAVEKNERTLGDFFGSLLDSYSNTNYITTHYGHLFSFQKQELKKITEEELEINKIINNLVITKSSEDLDVEDFDRRLRSIENRIYNLLQEELRLTYEKFESLSLQI